MKLNKLFDTTPYIYEIVIDTETTGLNLKHDRIIELAAIEIINRKEHLEFFIVISIPFSSRSTFRLWQFMD